MSKQPPVIRCSAWDAETTYKVNRSLRQLGTLAGKLHEVEVRNATLNEAVNHALKDLAAKQPSFGPVLYPKAEPPLNQS